MDQWYVLFTKPRKETQVYERLSLDGTEAFLPLSPLSPSGQRRSPRVLFPRYLFAKLDLARLSADAIRWTPGLVDFVRFGTEYAVVDETVIDYIKERLHELQDRSEVPFTPGQKVRVVGNHPLAMLDAVFEQPLSDAKRGYILLEMLGRITRCEVDLCNLEPVGPPSLSFGHA